MAEHIVKRYGPWKGINENPGECQAGELEDAWNVDFDGDVIATRGGREVVVSSTSWARKPLKVALYDGGAFSSDLTLSATSHGSSVDIGGFDSTDYLMVGFQSKESNLNVTIDTPNSSGASLAAEYFGSGGWKAVPGLYDGTDEGSGTLSVSKGFEWDLSSMSDWRATRSFGKRRLYLIRFKIVGDALSVGTAISGLCSDVSGADLKDINGLYQWARHTGERLLIVGMDNTDAGTASLCVYDRVSRKLKPFNVEGGAEGKSGPGAWWRFAVLNGMLICCNGYTLLHSTTDDPYKLVQFENSKLIEDAIDSNAPPASAAYIAVHNGSLYAVSKSAPNKVMISAPVGENNDLAMDAVAPLSGANIWYKDSSFNVEDPGGGHITGMVSVDGRLLIFTPRATHVWTGDHTGESGGYSMVDSSVGCVAPHTVASTPGAVFFLGDGGVYANIGGVNKLLSKRISKTVDNLNKRSLPTSCGVVYRKKNQYRLHVPAGANAQNDTCLVYNYANDTWTKYGVPSWLSEGTYWLKYKVKFAASIGDESWGEELLESDYSGQLLRADYGVYDGTKSIPSLAVFDRYFFEDQGNATIRHVRCEMQTTGEACVTCCLMRDGETWEKVGNQYVPYTMQPGEKIQNLLLLDDESIAAADQVYAIGTGTGVRSGTHAWRKRKFVSRRASFGLKARSFQIALHTGSTLCGKAMKIRGIEAEFIAEARR